MFRMSVSKAGWDMYGEKAVVGDEGVISIPFGNAHHGKKIQIVSGPFNKNNTLTFTVTETEGDGTNLNIPAQNIVLS